jgi:ribosome-associated heat shock protein Hsp15
MTQESTTGRIRIDKWLWAVRLFKTRSQATAACDQGKIMVGEQTVKASRLIKVGDHVSIKRTGITIRLEVLQAIEKRVGAKLVPEICKDLTPQEEIEAFRARATRMTIFRDPGTGRPTKKERRALDDFFNPFEEYPED